MGKYYHKQFTISDTAAPLTQEPLIFEELDLQCHDNNVLKGDVLSQTLDLAAGDAQSFRSARGIDIRPMFWKNKVGGSVGKITVDGSLL